MSRSSRRKTLSHSEIEDFLSEISVNVPPSNTNDDSIKSIQPQIENHDRYLPKDSTCNESAGIIKTAKEVIWIRELCKMRYKSPLVSAMQANEVMCKLGRDIQDSSNYPILPVRIMRPELYEFPPESMNAKKKLLLSLSPMLTDNEGQRKFDIASCEDFTRCRSSKGKGRFSSYEYTDFDTGCKVSFEEYERRYLMFIETNKKLFLAGLANLTLPSDTPIASIISENTVHTCCVQTATHAQNDCSVKKKSDVSVFSSGESAKENSPNINYVAATLPNSPARTFYQFDATDVLKSLDKKKTSKDGVNDRKRKNNSSSSERRVTLSPATARAMMLKAFEEDEPTVFPACPFIDFDLGSNNYGTLQVSSPPREINKELRSTPDIFSNPCYMDEEAAEPMQMVSVAANLNDLFELNAAVLPELCEAGHSAMDVEPVVESVVVEFGSGAQNDETAVVHQVTPELSEKYESVPESNTSSTSGKSVVAENDSETAVLSGLRAELDDLLAPNRDNDSPLFSSAAPFCFPKMAAKAKAPSVEVMHAEVAASPNDSLSPLLFSDNASPHMSVESSSMYSCSILEVGDVFELVETLVETVQADVNEADEAVTCVFSTENNSVDNAVDNTVDSEAHHSSEETDREVVISGEQYTDSEECMECSSECVAPPASAELASETEPLLQTEQINAVIVNQSFESPRSPGTAANTEARRISAVGSLLVEAPQNIDLLQYAGCDSDTFALLEGLVAQLETTVPVSRSGALHAFCNNLPSSSSSSSSGVCVTSAVGFEDEDEGYFFEGMQSSSCDSFLEDEETAEFLAAEEALVQGAVAQGADPAVEIETAEETKGEGHGEGEAETDAECLDAADVDLSSMVEDDEQEEQEELLEIEDADIPETELEREPGREPVSPSSAVVPMIETCQSTTDEMAECQTEEEDTGSAARSNTVIQKPTTTTTVPPRIPTHLHEQSFEFVFPAQSLDFGQAQEQAYKNRLHRFETARNMYQWELVSVKAANAAISRAQRKYNMGHKQ